MNTMIPGTALDRHVGMVLAGRFTSPGSDFQGWCFVERSLQRQCRYDTPGVGVNNCIIVAFPPPLFFSSSFASLAFGGQGACLHDYLHISDKVCEGNCIQVIILIISRAAYAVCINE
jgi:hypothetical protein